MIRHPSAAPHSLGVASERSAHVLSASQGRAGRCEIVHLDSPSVTDGPGGDTDLERVLAEIRATVDENTESGVYSESLEEELRSHFARILDRTDLDQLGGVWTAVEDLESLRSLPAAQKNTASRVPGGEIVHKAAGRIVDRQLAGAADRSELMWQATMVALRSIATVLDQPVSHTHAELLHELDTLQDRLALVERQLGRAKTATTSEAPYSTLEFDDTARGARSDILAEYSDLADRLANAPGPVLDIGAGRGELVELLVERGITVVGVEMDRELVNAARSRGLDIREATAARALGAATQHSLGAITLIHVIEHLPPNDVFDLIELAHDRLVPGGVLVMETPNPQSLYAHARAMWLDPTHLKPVHPIYLEFLVRQGGFEQVEFEWTATPSDDERLLTIDGDDPDAAVANENVRRLNQLIFAPQNYRVTATR